MYSEKDYHKAKSNCKLRVWCGIALIAVFVAVVVALVILEQKILQMVTAGLGFIVCYFVWDMKIVPFIRYNRFMKELKGGQRRKLSCRFVEKSAETRLYDGVEVYDVSVREIGDDITQNDEDLRLFVFDADKPFPALEQGDALRVTSFGSFITDIVKL